MASNSGAGKLSWEELKSGINNAFSSDRVDVDEVKQLMSTYVSDRSDWEQYEHFDKHTWVAISPCSKKQQPDMCYMC